MSYRALTDEQLAERAQAGIVSAEESLVKRYWDRTAKVARQCNVTGVEFDDVFSQALIALVTAIRTYNPAAGARFRTFYNRAIGCALIDVLRAATRKSVVPLSAQVNIDFQVDPGDGEALTIGDVIADGGDIHADLEARELAAVLGETFSGVDEVILRGALDGTPSREIRSSAGLTPREFDGRIKVIRSRVRAIIEGKPVPAGVLQEALFSLWVGLPADGEAA